jgi:peptidoglycan/LPS O-acetylase OafA/YrhL
LISRIDLCRGLLAFLVVAAHSYDVCWIINSESVEAMPSLVRKLLACTLQSGFYWVMGFFVISGYCIQLSVGRQLEAGRFPVGVYFAARLTRIMPLYYVGLFFTLAIELLVAPIRPGFYPDGLGYVGWFSQVFFAQRFFETFGSFAPSWTISYELFYYLFFGVLAAIAVRQGGRPAWVGMGLSVVLGGLLQAVYLAGNKNPLTLHLGQLFGLGTIWFLGALVAIHGPALVQDRSIRLLSRVWPAVFAVAVGRCRTEFIYLVTGVSFSLLLLRFHAIEEVRVAKTGPTPEWFGSLAKVVGLASYPTYLFHGPILLLVASTISHWGLVADWRVTWVILVTSGVGSGVVLGWLAERPIMNWRAGYLKRLKQAADTRTVARPAGFLGNLEVRGDLAN